MAIQNIVAQIQAYVRRDDDSIRSIDVNLVLNNSIKMVSNSLEHAANLKIDVAENLPPVLGNATRLQQVFVNLLNNSVRALDPERENKISLTARVDDAQKRIRIEVTDSGKGMNQEQLQRVFEPFYSGSNAGGMGLGLTISKDIIEDLGGTIEVESQPNQGTTVRVYLPWNSSKKPENDGLPSPDPTKLPRLRILVIDDEELVVKAIGRMLINHDVEAYTNADTALESYIKEPFDVVICDLMMPGTDGLAVYRTLGRDGNRTFVTDNLLHWRGLYR